jgi:hypothetical protein
VSPTARRRPSPRPPPLGEGWVVVEEHVWRAVAPPRDGRPVLPCLVCGEGTTTGDVCHRCYYRGVSCGM